MTPFIDPSTIDGLGRKLHPVAAQIHQATLGQGSIPPPSPQVPSALLSRQVSPPVAAAPQGNQPPAPVQTLNNPALTPNQQQRFSLPPPDRAQYKDSRLQNILGIIGAGLTGASNPAAGQEAARRVGSVRYDRAMKDYNSKIAPLDAREKVEEKNREEGTKQVAAKGAADYRQREIDQHRENARIAQERADTAEKVAKQRATEVAEHTKTIAALNKKNEDITKLHEAMLAETDPAKQAELKRQYEVLVPPKPVTPTAYNNAELAGRIQDSKNKANANPTGLAAAAGRAGAGEGARIAAEGTPQALKVEHDVSAVKTAGSMDTKTDPVMVAKQARLANALSVAKVSQQAKNTAEKAQVALSRFPDIEREVSAASDDLFKNRWKEFRTGTLGTEPDGEYTALRTDVDMIQSISAYIHSQRGSSKILNKFESLINVNKMEKSTFLSALRTMKKWMAAYSVLPDDKGKINQADIDKADAAAGGIGEGKHNRRDVQVIGQ